MDDVPLVLIAIGFVVLLFVWASFNAWRRRDVVTEYHEEPE